jgi:hypothetical protein
MPDVNELLVKAIDETKSLILGEIFLVRDLFKGYEWNRVAHKDRLLLGILFLNHVKSANEDVQAIEKTTSNQQRYKKM